VRQHDRAEAVAL